MASFSLAFFSERALGTEHSHWPFGHSWDSLLLVHSISVWLCSSKVGREFGGGKRTVAESAAELWKSHEEIKAFFMPYMNMYYNPNK